MKDKSISMRNWSDWCGTHTSELANAKDKYLWENYQHFAEEIIKEVRIVPDGEETHHLRVDLEHMYPYIEEGVYNA